MTYQECLETQRARAKALTILIDDAKGALDPTSDWYNPKDYTLVQADLKFLKEELKVLIAKASWDAKLNAN
jgi:hypothetical protein